jgi:hypothetical protein
MNFFYVAKGTKEANLFGETVAVVVQLNYFTLCLSGVNRRNVAKLITLKTIAIS